MMKPEKNARIKCPDCGAEQDICRDDINPNGTWACCICRRVNELIECDQ